MPRKTLFDDPPADDPRLPGSIGRVSEQSRIEAGKKLFEDYLKKYQERLNKPSNPDQPTTRLELFVPYLLVRSGAGDRGGRPADWQVSQSPDIWVAAGNPSSNIAAPP